MTVEFRYRRLFIFPPSSNISIRIKEWRISQKTTNLRDILKTITLPHSYLFSPISLYEPIHIYVKYTQERRQGAFVRLFCCTYRMQYISGVIRLFEKCVRVVQHIFSSSMGLNWFSYLVLRGERIEYLFVRLLEKFHHCRISIYVVSFLGLFSLPLGTLLLMFISLAFLLLLIYSIE